MSEIRKCPVCGDQIIGRIDKKFCSDQCRNTFNNSKYIGDTAIVQRINRVLKKNRGILGRLNPEGKTKVSRSRLIQEGFDFSHFTSNYTTQKGHTYWLCYDQGYLPLEDDMYLLIRWEG